jgi:ABC-type oligopeptide transport system substrate-binding subunit
MPIAVAATLIAAGASASAPPPPNTLAVELAVDIDYVDPALSYYVPTWTIEYATCAKLMNYPDRGAPEGSLLQPEVAAGMPAVSPDGKTYTFQIRDDFFFAPTNERVTAAHFKHAIDRDLNRDMNSPSQPFLSDIEGADAVIRGDTTSTSGVVADGNVLRITLLAPSADFLARLTMPFVCPLPLSVGITPNGMSAPVPSAGPYYIESWTRNSSIVLKENPFYTGDRPHHFDEIRYGIGLPLETIKLRIDNGETDWGDIPPAAHAELAAQYGPGSPAALLGRQRWFAFESPTVFYLAMNHDRPLFGDDPSTGAGLDPLGNVKLKQAVNHAIDRTAMMAQRGAFAGVPTDQHLPYGMPGFRDVDIYPSSPNIARARELAGWSPGDPMRNGVLYCADRAPATQICQIVQANLRQIGLEMEIKNFSRAEQFTRTGTRGEPFDMSLEGWHADYYDPFDFMFLLDGERLQPTNNVNFAYFNVPAYNERLDAANVLFGDARMTAFGDLDIDIARDAAPWAPYMVSNDRYYFSERIGCQTYVPPYTISLGALCVRPAISIGDVEAVEGGAATFTVTLAEAATADYPVTVNFATTDGTADSADYTPESGSLTFAAGEKTKTVTVNVADDATDEPVETFFMQLSANTKGTLVRGHAVGTILDDDEPATGAPEDVSGTVPPGGSLTTDSEGNGTTAQDPLETTVISPAGGAVSIHETASGTAVPGWNILGHQVEITAPPSTAADPLRLVFLLDASLGGALETATIFRNGSPVAACADTSGAASPDPCVLGREALAGGDAQLTILASQASRWNFGFVAAPPPAPPGPPPPAPPPPPPPPAPQPQPRPPAQVRCVVPNVKGKTLAAARSALARGRCRLGRVTRAYSAKVRVGKIISQSRRPGARLPRGTRVNVIVSRGKRR